MANPVTIISVTAKPFKMYGSCEYDDFLRGFVNYLSVLFLTILSLSFFVHRHRRLPKTFTPCGSALGIAGLLPQNKFGSPSRIASLGFSAHDAPLGVHGNYVPSGGVSDGTKTFDKENDP